MILSGWTAVFPALPVLPFFAVPAGLAGTTLAPSERGNSSYQEPNRAHAALDQQGEWVGRGDQFAQRVTVERGPRRGDERRGEPGGGRAGLVAQGVGRVQHRLAPVALGHARGGPFIQLGALRQDERGVDPGRDLDPGLLPPGGDRIAPGLDRIRPVALAGRGDIGAPAVGAGGELAHRRPATGAPVRIQQDHIGGDGVMALLEDGRGDLERLTGNGLGRPSAAVDEWADVEDGNATDHGITWGLRLGPNGTRRDRGGRNSRTATDGVRPF